MKKAIEDYAEKLIREYGDAAYQKAQDAVRAAHRRRNGRLEHFLEKVAHEVAKRSRPDLNSAVKLRVPPDAPVMPHLKNS